MAHSYPIFPLFLPHFPNPLSSPIHSHSPYPQTISPLPTLTMSPMASLLRRSFHHRILSRFSLSIPFSASSSPTPPIDKILIANRGEIACRIMRTAKRLGIRTVAVYSDADRDSLHVKFADEAIRIGPPPAKLSYLNANSIVDAARRAGAQAVHPGYGFLSENAEFAQLCENEGLSFIGPPASAIRDMGDKSASKRIMGQAAVPLVPGYHGLDQDIDLMKSEADKIGYPVLIKPTHGGGGKGMRIVQSPDEFVDSFLAAQREAASSFGVDTILLEKYITRPRHIEVQIFGDKHGNVLYLYERDCSLQRRHQKIIEEAPAPHVTEDFRAQVGQAAVSAAKAVGYYNAGTVEFIMDTFSGQFYFMEMNTRLQVEHPVTEMVVGQDLVEWQIRVANGEPLPIAQSEVPLSGHAFEARIYAENVPKGFLPATGVLHHYRPVPVSETIRVETGVEQGGTVSMHYDPMIAKLIVWGESRAAALVKLRDCLTKFQVAGVPTNISFLLQLAKHRAFEKGEVETHFIEHFKDDLFIDSSDAVMKKEQDDATKLSAIIVGACLCKKEHFVTMENQQVGSPLSIWYSDPPFRVNYCATQHLEIEWQNEYDASSSADMKLMITHEKDGSYVIQSGENGDPGNKVKVTQLDEHDFRIEVDGLSVQATLAIYSKGPTRHIHIWHGSHHHHFTQTVGLELSDEDESHHQASSAQPLAHARGSVVAPMAGLVVKVLVEDGAKVEAGQPVLVLEAMKMEHVVKAPSSGGIHELQVALGQQVSDGSILFKVKV